MSNYNNLIAATLLYIGTVDSVSEGIASVEITASDNKVQHFELPAQMFPCKIAEQDMFYFVYYNELVEIRCGEPPIK